jgi:hypothetical protein
MSETTVATVLDNDELQRPAFKGCVFCCSAEIAVYAVRKAVR